MRDWLSSLAFALCALAAENALAQTPLSCSAAPQSVCEDADLLALEGERASLIDQLTKLDPQNEALAGEQTWIDGLGACGEDVECYRTAYLNHNQALRQAVAALPDATADETPAEAPAPTMEEQTQALDQLQQERLGEPREDNERAYIASGAPGWGFYTAIGVTLFIFWWLMRALGRHRRDMRAERQRLR